ncbi:hypothetical protein QA596_02140 [Balneolales bacterium ANBcel1]|nr:hypothetical protein [Balneolales bacterium ANBcel1]
MKPSKCITAIFLIILVSSSLSQAAGDTGEFEVSGILHDAREAAPIVNKPVALYHDSGEQLAAAATDSEGSFSLVYEYEAVSAEPGGISDIPPEFRLGSSYPNPFNPKTTFPLRGNRFFASRHYTLRHSRTGSHQNLF